MIFKQFNDGSCDIEFSLKERWIILKNGKIHLSDEALRHFGNNLIKIVANWQLKFNEEVANKSTHLNTEIKGK